MVPPIAPNYDGRGLVNLMNEVEQRLSGSSPRTGLDSDLSAEIPHAHTYVIVLFDGLGTHQLAHAEAPDLRRSLVDSIDAPFPTTTTVSLATIATGRTPAEHGLIGYMLWDPQHHTTINTIHMTSAWGESVDLDLERFLPQPNVWQRLVSAGIEPVVVQPFNFMDSRLTRVLYGGARFEGYHSTDEAIMVTRDVASHEGRLVFLYVPFVDVAAHMGGQTSEAYSMAVATANHIWTRLTHSLPDIATMIGTADHGHIDIPDLNKIRLDEQHQSGSRLFGDARALYVLGDPEPILESTNGIWIPSGELTPYWGGEIPDRYRDRRPDGAIFMPDHVAVYAPYMNDRLIGHHGGLTAEERQIPLLVR
jgi:hypothetical protein